jgi:HSP20 family protein
MASNPFDYLLWQRASDLLEQAGRIHRNVLEAFVGVQYRPGLNSRASWVPPANVIETERAWWVLMALPGVKREQIEARLEGNELVIAGECALPECCQQGELRLWEISLGRFERRVSLEAGGAWCVGETVYRDGLLLIELKKS